MGNDNECLSVSGACACSVAPPAPSRIAAKLAFLPPERLLCPCLPIWGWAGTARTTRADRPGLGPRGARPVVRGEFGRGGRVLPGEGAGSSPHRAGQNSVLRQRDLDAIRKCS
ncbi:hypothetical protein cypCar_00025554 [Cyprinus carpio]|nr:hypothetical protein cypCar_00025554 [Cyprinus carpio]